jgi:hypothetical protein
VEFKPEFKQAGTDTGTSGAAQAAGIPSMPAAIAEELEPVF